MLPWSAELAGRLEGPPWPENDQPFLSGNGRPVPKERGPCFRKVLLPLSVVIAGT